MVKQKIELFIIVVFGKEQLELHEGQHLDHSGGQETWCLDAV